jgi:hypothetical protein
MKESNNFEYFAFLGLIEPFPRFGNLVYNSFHTTLRYRAKVHLHEYM